MNIKEKLRKIPKRNKIIIAVVIVLALIAITVLSVNAIKAKKEKDAINDYLSQRIETYGEINIMSAAAVIDGKKNTVAGIKEAFRLGADTVTVDLCFNENDVPVICEKYDDINKETLKLEDVFKLLKDEKYSDLKLNLRLRQLSSLEKFNALLKKYDMSGRVIISGINSNRYSMISGNSTSAGVFFDYAPQKDRKKSLNEINGLRKEYNISGVIISCDNITKELAETLNQRGITYIISGTDEELDMYSVLSSGANNIETSSPEKLLEVYSLWKEKTRENIDKEILEKLNQKG